MIALIAQPSCRFSASPPVCESVADNAGGSGHSLCSGLPAAPSARHGCNRSAIAAPARYPR